MSGISDKPCKEFPDKLPKKTGSRRAARPQQDHRNNRERCHTIGGGRAQTNCGYAARKTMRPSGATAVRAEHAALFAAAITTARAAFSAAPEQPDHTAMVDCRMAPPGMPAAAAAPWPAWLSGRDATADFLLRPHPQRQGT
jgi:hypothetical protein